MTLESRDSVFNVDEFLDSRPISAWHVLIVVILGLVLFMDGYDIFLVGVIAPAIAKAMNIEPSALTRVFVAQQGGLLVGTSLIGPLSDRYGRKATLLACLTCFGLCTAIVPLVVTTLNELAVIRFISAILFSGALPNCIALASETAPKRLRGMFVSLMFAGYGLGTSLCAFVLVYVVNPIGWGAGFYIGGALTLLLVPIVYFLVPESIRYLAARNEPDHRLPGLLKRVDPNLQLTGNEKFTAEGKRQTKGAAGPIASLFQGGMARLTLLIWSAYFLTFMANQFVTNWETTVLHTIAGMSYERIGLLLSCKLVFGLGGFLVTGIVLDRLGATRALAVFLIIATVMFAGLGAVDLNSIAAFAMFILSAYTLGAALTGLNAKAAFAYPPHARVTGLAWGAGLGRLGGMLGPMLGGALIAGTPNTMTFYLVAAVLTLFSAVSILAMLIKPTWTSAVK